MKNKTLAIIAAIFAPWALIAYSVYKHATWNYEKPCCKEDKCCEGK